MGLITMNFSVAGPPDPWHDGFQALTSLGWPAVVIVFLVLFRVQIGKLIDRIKELNIAGQSIKADLTAATVQVEQLQSSEPPPATPSIAEAVGHAAGSSKVEGRSQNDSERPTIATTALDELNLIVEADLPLSAPREAVLQAWSILGRGLRAVAKREGQDIIARKMPWQVATDLAKRGTLSPQVLGSISNLRKVRNDAAHPGAAVETVDAENYISLVQNVLPYLDA
jgi:hypothetical protein